MRRVIVLTLLLVTVLASVADAQRRRRGRSQKDAALEAEEKKALVEQVARTAPGYIRWFEAFATTRGQLKITRVDPSHAPELRLHLSILRVGKETNTLEPLFDLEQLRELDVRLARGDENRPQDLVTFGPGGVEPEEGPAAKLLVMDQADIPLDAVVVAAGHSGYKEVEQLESQHRAAVTKLLSRLGDARSNVMWYGSMLYTYRTFPGLSGELSRFDEDLRQCEIDRLKFRLQEHAERGEEDPAPEPPPCGLHAGKGGDMAQAVDAMRFRGKHSRLFGLSHFGIEPCTDISYTSTALRHLDLDEVEQRTTDAGAFEEALRLLVRYGGHGHRKALIVLSEGRDGYLEDDAECRRLYTNKAKFCANAGEGLRGRKAREKIQQCVQGKLDERSTILQERFRDRATNWIALARAAGVRVYTIAYGAQTPDGTLISYPWERERLEMLSLKTGGTYREVLKPGDIDAAAEATAAEIMGEYVIKVDADLESETPYKVEVSATIADSDPNGPVFQLFSKEVEFRAPLVPSGFWWWAKQKNQWLKSKVGTILYWVIVVVAAVLLLLILWLVFKLFKAMVMKFVGLFVKKGKAVAKGAAKGAR